MPDNYDMWESHDRDQEKKLSMMPVCNCCHKPIQQTKAIYYNSQWCCESCEEIFWMDIREDFLEKTMED